MADSSLYPQHTIERLLHTGHVSTATRAVLEQRLATKPAPPRFFGEEDFLTLSLVCDHLLALKGTEPAIFPAHAVDERLAENRSNGWRYGSMPDDCTAFRLGLKGIRETSEILYHATFAELNAAEQAAVLHLVQRGEAPGESWKGVSSIKFFEELLTEMAELFYSYPYAQNEIGYTGAADRHGWQRIGLNEHEDIEPAETIILSILTTHA